MLPIESIMELQSQQSHCTSLQRSNSMSFELTLLLIKITNAVSSSRIAYPRKPVIESTQNLVSFPSLAHLWQRVVTVLLWVID